MIKPWMAISVLSLTGPTAWGASTPIALTAPKTQPAATVISEFVIAKQPGRYMAWPDLITRPNGEMIAVFSGDRDSHVDANGKVMAVRSADGGTTWSNPELWADPILDQRNTGIEVLNDGSLFVTYESSTAYLNGAQPTPAQAAEKGYWSMRSTDGGVTWLPRTKMVNPTAAVAPHGPTKLSNGNLLIVKGGSIATNPATPALVLQSTNNGNSWQQIGSVTPNPNTWKQASFISEPHIIEVPLSGGGNKLICLARYRHLPDVDQSLRQMESTDGGITWTEPHDTGMFGYPASLMHLNNGWLVASYGRRASGVDASGQPYDTYGVKGPSGQRASISIDNGATWLTDHEIILSNAVTQNVEDLGYATSTVQADGTIWSMYYQVPAGVTGRYPALMGTKWKINQAFNTVRFYDSAETAQAGDKPSTRLGSYVPLYTDASIVKAGTGTNSLGNTHPAAVGGGSHMMLIDRPANIGRRHVGTLTTAATQGKVRLEADLMNQTGWISFGLTSEDGGLSVAGTPVAIYITLADNGSVMYYDPAGSGWTTIAGLSHTVDQWQKYALEYTIGAPNFKLHAGTNSVWLEGFAAANLTSVSQINGFNILGGTTTAVGYIDNIKVTAPPPLAAVPEPASMALLAGTTLFLGRRRLSNR